MVSYVCDISGYPDEGKRKGIVKYVDSGSVDLGDDDEIVIFIRFENDEEMPTADKSEPIRIWKKESDAVKFGI